MSATGPIVIAGGGLASLYAALLMRDLGERRPIVIVERADEVGGLLRAIDKGEWGRFDQGMHTFTSTGIAEIDDAITGLLPGDEWVWLRDFTRDLSGLVFNGTLQHHCHYPDLRLLGEPAYQECLADFRANLARPDPPPPANMEEFSLGRFGPLITERVIEPSLRKLYGRPARAIDPVVARLLPFDRVALFDEETFKPMLADPRMRGRVAYPEQRNLPLEFSSGKFSVYPRAFGAHRLIDAIVERLATRDVTFMTGQQITGLDVAGGRATALRLRSAAGEARLDDIAMLWWTAGVLPLAALLGLAVGREKFEAPKIAALMNVLLDRRLDLGDLYYFWCFDPAFASFRVTNFINFSPGAVRRGGYPVCIEFFLDPGDPLDEASLVDRTMSELRAFGAVPDGTRVLASAGHAPPVGFPILSTGNRALLARARADIDGRGVSNLGIAGIQSSWGVVFQPDVLEHTWRAVRAYYDRV